MAEKTDFTGNPGHNNQYDSGKNDNPGGVMEVTPDKRIVFDFRTTGQVWSCQRLADGTTLIGAASQGKLLVVSPEAKVLKAIKLRREGAGADRPRRPGAGCFRHPLEVRVW